MRLRAQPALHDRLWAKTALMTVIVCLSCCSSKQNAKPQIHFDTIPIAAKGGPDYFGKIEGSVTGARSGQLIVLFARSGDWWVQPYADNPFTQIDVHSRWKNSTHLGTEYAALLVDPSYRPPASTAELPPEGNGVLVVEVVPGAPALWQRGWFQLACAAALGLLTLVYLWLRLKRMRAQMALRFEERLAERMRIAQDLHDTLLQGVLSASMQLHVIADNMPADSSSKPALDRVLQLMGHVIEEGRNALQGLRTSSDASHGLEQAFSRIREELAIQRKVDFRVISEGQARPLHPVIRDETYRIGREALANAFRHSGASKIEVELEYSASRLRILIRDNGCGIEPKVLRSGRDGHWGLSGMRERADRIGAKLRLWSRTDAGTEVDLSVPGHIAFRRLPNHRSRTLWARLFSRKEAQHDALGQNQLR